MKKIILSLGIIAIVAVGAIGATRSFFSDTETSTGNTFTAGAIDLTVDSTQHYNGNVCVPAPTGAQGYVWSGNAPYPVAGTACDGSWLATDLGAQKFFNFTDIKPGDSGENTISLHVNNNDAWACVDVNVTKNSDMTSTEPELGSGDVLAIPGSTTDGELAQNVYFTAWADDGDNVWEEGEPLLFTNHSGPASDVLGGKTYALADSTTGGVPLTGDVTKNIGLAWCAGTQTVTEDPNTITCSGASMGNNTQTDSMEASVAFRVEQSRNNAGFKCSDSTTPEEEVWVETTQAEGDASIIDGVLQLTTINDTASRVRYTNDNLNLDVADVTLISFDSKQVSAFDAVNGNATMRLIIDEDGNISTPDTVEITYEPYYNYTSQNPSSSNTSIVTGLWQTWNTTLANGKFWANGNFLGSTPNGGAYATNFTLAQVQAAYPNAKIIGMSMGMGTWNKDQVVLVDNVTVNGTVLGF